MNNCNYMYVTKINKFAYIAEQHALMYTHLQPFVCGVRPDPRAGGGVDGGGCSVISAVSRRRVGCFSASNRRRHQRSTRLETKERVNGNHLLRVQAEYDAKMAMSYANNLMLEVEHKRVIPTIYVPCPPMLTQISSSRVRELVGLRRGIDVLRHFVLPPVAEVISEEIYKRKTGS